MSTIQGKAELKLIITKKTEMKQRSQNLFEKLLDAISVDISSSLVWIIGAMLVSFIIIVLFKKSRRYYAKQIQDIARAAIQVFEEEQIDLDEIDFVAMATLLEKHHRLIDTRYLRSHDSYPKLSISDNKNELTQYILDNKNTTKLM